MRYNDCTNDRGCHSCSLVSYGKDCRNNPVHPLAYQRKISGLSQSQLADLIGVAQQHVSRWENGKHRPSIDILMKIAVVLSCNIGDLI